MKNIYLLLLFSFSLCIANAQIVESRAEYNKVDQSALKAEYKYPPETVEKSLTDKLERMGLKVKKSGGYMVVYNSVINSINDDALDYAFKAERKSRREKDISTLIMIINRNNENVVSANISDARSFLTDLGAAAAGVNADNMIMEQYDAVAKAEKKLKNLEEDKENLEKKIRNLQDDLRKNEKDTEDQQKEIVRQKEILEARKAEKVK